MMSEVIHGQLLNVIDGQTFNLRITHLGKENRHRYQREERIRMIDVKVGEHLITGEQLDQAGLEKILTGHALKCLIQGRDKFGSLSAKIRLL
ncbi:hypothetical protein WDW89_11220 [Deltaproteobacteria bacterium TL4]